MLVPSCSVVQGMRCTVATRVGGHCRITHLVCWPSKPCSHCMNDICSRWLVLLCSGFSQTTPCQRSAWQPSPVPGPRVLTVCSTLQRALPTQVCCSSTSAAVPGGSTALQIVKLITAGGLHIRALPLELPTRQCCTASADAGAGAACCVCRSLGLLAACW